VQSILGEYRDQLPLSRRQVLYIGDGAYWVKTEDDEKIGYVVQQARRSGLIPWKWIRDDSVYESVPPAYADLESFWNGVREEAAGYTRPRLEGQAYGTEVWCEAAGMIPQLRRVAWRYGVPVYSSSGSDKDTLKFAAAARFAERPTLVLHIGDFDPDGLTIFDSVAADVEALARGFAEQAGRELELPCEFVRLAVPDEQARILTLNPLTERQRRRFEDPARAKQRRGDFDWLAFGGTVQAEAINPRELARLLEEAIRSRIDLDIFEGVVSIEKQERENAISRVEELLC
jgi:hypothetical protein